VVQFFLNTDNMPALNIDQQNTDTLYGGTHESYSALLLQCACVKDEEQKLILVHLSSFLTSYFATFLAVPMLHWFTYK